MQENQSEISPLHRSTLYLRRGKMYKYVSGVEPLHFAQGSDAATL